MNNLCYGHLLGDIVRVIVNLCIQVFYVFRYLVICPYFCIKLNYLVEN